jgi:hypothetical protein
MNHAGQPALPDFAIGEPRRVWLLVTKNPCLTCVMSESSTNTLVAPVLATADRCDRCGAQAYVMAELPGGATLLFCGHHWGAHEAALQPKVVKVVNELHRLNERS